MFDQLCEWPFLSLLAVAGLIVLLAARGRMGDERDDLTSQTIPVQVRIDAKRTVQTVSEGGHDYRIEFVDPRGETQNIRVSKRFYRQARPGDTIEVYRHPAAGEYVHGSDQLAFAKASTSVMWAVGWILIFIGVVDIVVYAILGEDPWCLVVQSWAA